MKPVVIIAIAVGCSVAAVFGVLFAWQGVATMQAQEAFDEYQTELEKQAQYEEEVQALEKAVNREICVGMYGTQNIGMGDELSPYGYCLEFGPDQAVDQDDFQCELDLDTQIVVDFCKTKNIVSYFNSAMPILEELSYEERTMLGVDSEMMSEFRIVWNLKSAELDGYYKVFEKLEEESKIKYENYVSVSPPGTDFSNEEEIKLPPYEEPESFAVDDTLSKVAAQMAQCERNLSESYCKQKLMSNIVQYCGTTQNKNSCISELIEKFTIPLQ